MCMQEARWKQEGTDINRIVSMQEKLKLSEEQTCALVESRNLYLLSIGFHSAGLARLQSQLMASLRLCPIT